MGSTNVITDTDPEKTRRLHSGGPAGFVLSLKQTLERLDRPYLFAGSVPHFLMARSSDSEQDVAFSDRYEDLKDRSPRRDLTAVDHAIIHQSRKYPADTGSGTPSDSPRGAGKQKTPMDSWTHSRPVPSEEPSDGESQEGESEGVRPAVDGDAHERPPLWDSMEQVPDLIRDHVEPDTLMYVTVWEYDVFVDLALVAANQHLLTDMRRDLLTILQTFHHRWATGASNLSGWMHQMVDGAPSEIEDDLRGDFPRSTITWRLEQTEAYAFPLRELETIEMNVHGRQFRKFGGV